MKVIELHKTDVFRVHTGYETVDNQLKGKRLIRCYVDGATHAMDIDDIHNAIHRIHPGTEVNVIGTMMVIAKQ